MRRLHGIAAAHRAQGRAVVACEITPAESRADHGFRRQLVREADTGSPYVVIGLYIRALRYLPEPGKQEVSAGRIVVHSSARMGWRRWPDVLPPQSVVNAELLRDAPGVLGVPGNTRVPLTRKLAKACAVVTRRHTQQEGPHAQARARDVGIGRDELVEVEISTRALI